MKRILIILASAMALLLFAAVQSNAEEQIIGAKVYSDNCGRCHQPRAPSEYSDQSWDIIIHHMHVRGYLTSAETKAVTKYLQQNNFRRAAAIFAPSKTGTPDGKALVAAKGCQGCHVLEKKGGTIGPSLDTVLSRRDEAFVKSKLADPKFENPRSIMPYFGFNKAEIEAILTYLRELNSK